MATESIFVPIKIETKEEIERFAKALEQAEAVAIERTDTSELFRDATESDIAAISSILVNA